jgi:L-seryl-tRNA(Ser) seleniumtransferase
MPNELLRSLPSVERMLGRPAALALSTQMTRDRIRDLLREILDDLRDEIALGLEFKGIGSSAVLGFEAERDVESEVEKRLERRAATLAKSSLQRVINATGVIIHTNLGRAPLAAAAISALTEAASGYSNLEYDLERGQRGHRHSHSEHLITRLLGCQSSLVVNNNAAAVLLVLSTLAEGGEVIVSRGELIEIGGSFRIPEIMERSGARLKEVGTTNRTRISDYSTAINEHTRLIMRVHPSNYRIVGFTERPELMELVELSRRSGIPSFEDLGSGCMTDLTPYGISGEPQASESISAGIDVICFSGDKMLGGPQAGVIAGSRTILDRLKKSPLMRALRVDKLTYAALEATLRVYERGAAETGIPVIKAMAETREHIERRAQSIASTLASQLDLMVELEPGYSVIGGGSAPGVSLPSVLLGIKHRGLSAASVEARLRMNKPPIVTRTDRDQVLIDLRTVAPDEEAIIVEALVGLTRQSNDSDA